MKFIEFFVDGNQPGGAPTSKFINPMYVESVTPDFNDRKSSIVMISGDKFIISKSSGEVVDLLESVKP
jgi:hypothetical protein